MSKKMVRLENWINWGNTLTGKVFGHPKLEDETLVVTSNLVNLDEDNKTAETQNTIYTLGKKADEKK